MLLILNFSIACISLKDTTKTKEVKRLKISYNVPKHIFFNFINKVPTDIMWRDIDFKLFFITFVERTHQKNNSSLYENVYSAAIAKSFHEQCVPKDSVHLGYSAWCMHWLSQTYVQLLELINRNIKNMLSITRLIFR